MEWVIWASAVILFVFWGIPSIRFLFNRLLLILGLMYLKIKTNAYFVFRSPFSVLSFNKGKKTDLMVVYNRQVYFIKFGGSFKRATIIVVTSPKIWQFHTFYRSPSLSGAPIIEPTRHDVVIEFDVVKDLVQFRNKSYQEIKMDSYTPVYMLTPKPLNISAVDGENRQLSNGDEFFGMTLFTSKHFFKRIRTQGKGQKLSKHEKKILRKHFKNTTGNC